MLELGSLLLGIGWGGVIGFMIAVQIAKWDDERRRQ